MTKLNLTTYLGWYKIEYLNKNRLEKIMDKDYKDETHQLFVRSLFSKVKSRKKKLRRKDKISFKHSSYESK